MHNQKFNIDHPRTAGWMVFVILLIVTQLIAAQIFRVERENELVQLEHETQFFKNHLETSLNYSKTATNMLAFLAEKDILKDNFDAVCADIMTGNPFIDALQLVEGNVITRTYPIEGNEEVLLYNLLNDSIHKRESGRARERKQLYFEGPFKLIQGGTGIVGRLPIFKDGVFWGFSAVIIRTETLMSAFGLDESGENERYYFQLAKSNPIDSASSKLFDHGVDFTKGMVHSAAVPLGDWKIYLKTKKPVHFQRTWPFALTGILLAAVMGVFTWYMSVQPRKLRLMVNEKTKSLKSVNTLLKKNTRELKTLNKDLEQFAYIASHDLQEPLRMITSFLAQLQKKYRDQLDEKANQYIHFAVDGAMRMRRIIQDLLIYSHISKTEEPRQKLDLQLVVDEVKTILRSAIKEKSAQINVGELPTISGHRAPLILVFQNLIGNALKYAQKDKRPEIEISSKDLGKVWEISVSDNGIGIDKEYHQKIFILFERLHTQEEYSGTGLGLSIVKKVIENEGGRVSVKSEPGKGTTICFTLPKIT